MLPTVAYLPFAKQRAQALTLPHKTINPNFSQTRLAGRVALEPIIDLDAYRFKVVIDWIEFHVHFSQITQVQHVQQVLRQFIDRNSYIDPDEEAPGRTFDACTIRVQEPKSLAQVAMAHQALAERFGEAAESRITGIEVSVDAYPAQPSHTARMALLGALQRTIWTGRDIWRNPDSRPRTVFGKGKMGIFKLSPEPELEAKANKAKIRGELASRVHPDHHKTPPVDGTMYLGAKYDEVMIRIMDKVKDQQRPGRASRGLSDNEKRVRIEVTVKGAELLALGITNVASLRTLKLSVFQKKYFQFRLPTFKYRAKPKTGADAVLNLQEEWRAQIYLRSGLTGLMTADETNDAHKDTIRRGVNKTLRNMNLMQARTWSSKRLTASFCSWKYLNRKVHVAFKDLEKREATAWRKMEQQKGGT